MTDVAAERAAIDAQLPPSIAAAFAATTERLGDAPAYSDKVGIEGPGWRTLSWNQLRDQGLDVAAALIDAGVEPGDRVAIMATNRIEHILADVGAMHAGATGMSIYNTLSPSQVSYVAEHSSPAVVVLENADHLARWREAFGAATPKRVVVIDPAAGGDGTITWDELVARGQEVRAELETEIEKRWTSIERDQPATILYTSGTTGNPKGVVITHHNVLFELASTDKTVSAEGTEHIALSYLPYAHVAERVLGIYLPQINGGSLYLIADPKLLVGALGQVRPTRFFGVPRVWEKIQTGINGLLAMETDEAKKQAVADAMAVGLENVTSLE